jgi:hypothetical protein
VTQSTPPADPQAELYRAAEWAQKNHLTIASIEAAAADLLVQMKAVSRAHEDPKGARVAEMRSKFRRLVELTERLDAFGGRR